ncbi:hypothetical protein FRB91_010439 [Serendipita sp. 411]|nr:hypothetical protein FRC18_010424 [Serendipita sp. 400]KAG8848844.1 hypothetical protein FRB91_010439 [Serendipita sp. 411]KAG9053579.1 hypothetical protein FS842_007789 [Serendipita sp. 407]
MSEDFQMDVEGNLGPVAQSQTTFAHGQNSGFQAFQWGHNPLFTASAYEQEQPLDDQQLPPGEAGSSSIPPSVVASIPMYGGTQISGSERIPAKMHIRRPGRDNWSYIGRVGIYQELSHKTPIVVVRLQSNDKTVTTFTEHSNISVDKRGNFIVVASVEPAGVISYSLHAQTNNDALRLLESIELAAYKLGSITGNENRSQVKLRKRIEKTIKDDRRRRHKRRKEDDALVAMLDGTTLEHPAPVQ